MTEGCETFSYLNSKEADCEALKYNTIMIYNLENLLIGYLVIKGDVARYKTNITFYFSL